MPSKGAYGDKAKRLASGFCCLCQHPAAEIIPPCDCIALRHGAEPSRLISGSQPSPDGGRSAGEARRLHSENSAQPRQKCRSRATCTRLCFAGWTGATAGMGPHCLFASSTAPMPRYTAPIVGRRQSRWLHRRRRLCCVYLPTVCHTPSLLF
jgi:hypothetical protein